VAGRKEFYESYIEVYGSFMGVMRKNQGALILEYMRAK
jgi:hypothetical protein